MTDSRHKFGKLFTLDVNSYRQGQAKSYPSEILIIICTILMPKNVLSVVLDSLYESFRTSVDILCFEKFNR